MAIPSFFKNLGKSTKDLLTKDYEQNLPALKFETKTDNNATVTIEARRDTKKDEVIVDPFQIKRELPERGFTFIGKATTNRRLTGEFSVSDKIAKGLKLTTSASTILVTKPDQNPENTAKLSIEYTRDNLAVTADLELVKRVAYVSTVIGNKSLALGGEIEANLLDGILSKYNVTGAYYANNFVLNAFARDQLQSIGSSFFRKVSDNYAAGGEFTYRLNASDATFTLGGECKFDKDSSMKAKVDSKGILSLSYIHNFRKNIRSVFSTQIDALHLNKGDAMRIGFGLTITDE